MPMTMNERLEHARVAITAYFEAKGEPLPEGPWDFEDTDASDLIADLLHLQKRLGLRGTLQTIRTAMLHFEAEEEEGPHYPCALCDCVEVSCPRFDGDTREPGVEAACSSRCQMARVIESLDDMPNPQARIITVRVQGGLVQEVSGIPAGCELRVEDHDDGDRDHPSWNPNKGCFVTIYEGGV
jgi:hypothetical protein